MREIRNAADPASPQVVLAAIGSQLGVYFAADRDSNSVPQNLSGLLKRLRSQERPCR